MKKFLKSNGKYIQLILIMAVIASLILVFASGSNYLVIVPVWLLFIYIVIYCLRAWEENIFLFCFLACIFTFLLCGQTINKIFQVYGYTFPEEIEFHADIVLLLSLFGILFGYILTKKVRIKLSRRKTNMSKDYDDGLYNDVRYISKLLYYGTYVFWLMTLLDTVLYVIQKGYASYYLSFSNRVPSYIREIAYMAPMAFYIFLATMPNKKEAKIPIVLYMLYTILSLGTGRRIHFMVGLVFVFAYMVLRNTVNPGEKPWISKKVMILICIAVPAILVVMYLFEYVRSEAYVGTSSQYSPIIGFFVRQGTSINVIKYGELFKDSLNKDAYYSFYNTIKWFQNSMFSKIFEPNALFTFGKQSQETAINGTYLADFISYKANRSIYESGMGYGSSYIEELYIDFGYIGVFLGNFFYGGLMCKLLRSAKNSKNIWVTAIIFFMINEIFKAPRATFDACFGRLLYFSNWGPVVIIFLFVYLYRRAGSVKSHSKLERIPK